MRKSLIAAVVALQSRNGMKKWIGGSNMKNFLVILLVLVFVHAALGDVRTITVDGYCYLEDQTIHWGTKVKFIEVSPSAVTDSTYTDSLGYFIISGLYEGIYDVECTHEGYDTTLVEDQVLISSTTLPPVTLQVRLSGSLQGILGSRTYHIIGNISVNSGDSLTLLPGTTFIFDGPYPFMICGTLLAEGTESDSIAFTTEQSDSNRWRGLRFVDSGSSGSHLAYCLIEKGNAIGQGGGGVYCSYSSPTFTNCTISGNSAQYGGGVGCWDNSSPAFTNCRLSGNSAVTHGGGLLCEVSSSTFGNCTISGNSAGTGGGGAYCSNSSSTFTNCTVSGNWANTEGGGVYCRYSSPTFTNCTLSANSASWGAGVNCYHSSPTFNSTTIAFSIGSGIHFNNSPGSQFLYCDIFGNADGNFAFHGNDPSQGPVIIGVPLIINANGDSADTYMNIFCDPMFADTAAGDYHLTEFSHCLGAGEPADTVSTDFEGDPRPNPSWSYPDIGADEHWSGSAVLHLVIVMSGGNAILHWTPYKAGPYYIYGAATPFAEGELLDTVTDAAAWTDNQTSTRPSPYFYYVTGEEGPVTSPPSRRK